MILFATKLPQRFWDKVYADEYGCWLWTASNKGPYGSYFFLDNRRKRTLVAHRPAYEDRYGPIPEGMEIDHLCRIPPCVNPRHLEAVTPRENQRRSMGPAGINARKTHCPRGHEFSPGNTYIFKDGARRCRRCCLALRRRQYAASKIAKEAIYQ